MSDEPLTENYTETTFSQKLLDAAGVGMDSMGDHAVSLSDLPVLAGTPAGIDMFSMLLDEGALDFDSEFVQANIDRPLKEYINELKEKIGGDPEACLEWRELYVLREIYNYGTPKEDKSFEGFWNLIDEIYGMKTAD